jgi:O-antigen ligase
MPVLISLAIVFALAKDVVYFGAISDSLRIGSLGLAGAVGIVFMLTALGRRGVTSYLPMLLYCVWCVIPIVSAQYSGYLLYQILSLLCVVFAGIGAFGRSSATHEQSFRALSKTLVWILGISLGLSIACLWAAPARVWEYPIGDVRRFRGLMSDAPALAIAAGLLAGFAWAVARNPLVRFPLVALGVVVLVFTGSRGPFIAMVLAALSVAAVHKSAKVLLGAGVAAVAIGGVILAAGAHVDKATVDRAVRADSLSNLSGRLALWQHGWELARKQPVFGSGLTMGSQALASGGSMSSTGSSSLANREQDARAVARVTFHNGYLQAYMDSGLGGALLYLLVIVAATWRALTSEKTAESGVILYVMLFLAISNMAQNAVQGPSTVHGVVFWLLAAAAAALPRKVVNQAISTVNVAISPATR